MTAHKLLVPLTVAVLAAACSDLGPSFHMASDRAASRAVSPSSDPFQQALYQGYMTLAAEQDVEGDYHAAHIYYRKAIASAEGTPVALEEAGRWTRATGLRAYGLHDADLAAVVDMRPQLESWINETKAVDPRAAAAQQIKFDCWIEELNEQEYADAAACKPAIVAAMKAPPPAAVAAPQPFLVFFDFDKSDITPEADRIIRSAADAWKRGQSPRVTATGHTDRAGTVTYNQGLSDRRAAAVKARLVQYGVTGDLITTIGKGESEPLVPTADGVREPQNRRVEILIMK